MSAAVETRGTGVFAGGRAEAAPEPARARACRAVRGAPRSEGPARVVGKMALLAAAAAAVGLFHVWSHTRVTAAGYRLGELQRAQESLRVERNRLEVEVATLRAPGRLEAFARARLGMAPPAAGAVVAGWTGEAAAGRAGRAGGWESLRPAPAEPVATRLGAATPRPAAGERAPAGAGPARARADDRVALREARPRHSAQ